MDGIIKLARRCTLACVALAALAVPVSAALTPAVANAAELSPYVSVSGNHLALSVDAYGSNSEAGGPIRVEKTDASETVRAAYLFAATVPGAAEPQNGDVTLEGNPLEWEAGRTIPSAIGSYNALANVTSIVKPIVDAASPGLIPLTVAEGSHTYSYDGEILAVILEDPAVSEARSFTLLYGALNPFGATFNVGLSEPGVDKANPNYALNLGLGISYGYQPAGQYSTVEVNKKLMSSSAGGQDDCAEKYSSVPDWGECGNGELITAGGIGDTTADPPNPEATDETCENEAHEPAPRCDDELYSLLPFVNENETNITFNTTNPSDNDNIFFGALEVRGGAAVIGEGITLAPPSGNNKVGEMHTVTATLQDEHGAPLENTVVHFLITSGPNAGKTGEATTGANGKASFSYSSSAAGTDTIVASFLNVAGAKFESNEVLQTWEAAAATTTPPAKTEVLATKTKSPGTAHLASTGRACVASSGYTAKVSGKLISSVTFVLDGHKLKTLKHPNSGGSYSLHVGVKSGSPHHLQINVAFSSASSKRALTIKKTLARCAAVHVKPTFTG